MISSPSPRPEATPQSVLLVTIKEAAAALCVSESWLKRSDIPFVKMGRLRRYAVRDIERYVAKRSSGRVGGNN